MNWADWVIIGILLISCLFGLIRGFVREALSLVIWILAALCAHIFAGSIDSLLVSLIETPSIRSISAFAIIFVLILLLGALVQHLISVLIKASGLTFLDRALGIAFGVVRGLVVVMVLLLVSVKLTQVQQDHWWKESELIPILLQWSDPALKVFNQLSDWLMQLFGVAQSQSI